MKRTIACLVAAATSVAMAQTPPPSKTTQAPAAKAPAAAAKPGTPTAPKQAACAECGVVASVREVSKESKANPNDGSKPSGFVVSVPLGGGGSASAGSSSRIGKDVVQSVSTWEVIVRLDDGRVRIFRLDEPPEVRKDDKVRIENGQPVLRTD